MGREQLSEQSRDNNFLKYFCYLVGSSLASCFFYASFAYYYAMRSNDALRSRFESNKLLLNNSDAYRAELFDRVTTLIRENPVLFNFQEELLDAAAVLPDTALEFSVLGVMTIGIFLSFFWFDKNYISNTD